LGSYVWRTALNYGKRVPGLEYSEGNTKSVFGDQVWKGAQKYVPKKAAGWGRVYGGLVIAADGGTGAVSV